MLRDERGSRSLVYWPPRSRPLYEQVALLQRIAIARVSYAGKAGLTWEEIAQHEGIPKRTLQHFYRSSIDGPRIHGYRRRERSRRT